MDTLQDLDVGSVASAGSLNVHEADRIRLTVLHSSDPRLALAADVRRGLTAPQKSLPPKYFYDECGAHLFDAICELPEYYLTRAEHALLERIADDLIERTRPTQLLELGSGASRKTRLLLDAIARAALPLRYSPFDVSAEMLRSSALSLLEAYPTLHIHAYVGDYERDLSDLRHQTPRLVAFLGSTIGNFDPLQTAQFLRSMRTLCGREDWLLLGVDLVKSVHTIEAAYNDADGITAAFNRNVLRVMNRELDANFRPERFEHLAFFNRELSQIEMHLRAAQHEHISIGALDLEVDMRRGETIHTEISRKFTRSGVESTLKPSGFVIEQWYEAADASFALVLARRV